MDVGGRGGGGVCLVRSDRFHCTFTNRHLVCTSIFQSLILLEELRGYSMQSLPSCVTTHGHFYCFSATDLTTTFWKAEEENIRANVYFSQDTLFPSHGAPSFPSAKVHFSELLHSRAPQQPAAWALLTQSSEQWPAPWKTRLPSGAGWWGWES